MKAKLSPWSKAVKKEMIDRDMNMGDIAEAVGMAREYVSGVINGRVYSEPAVKKISDYLNIEEQEDTLKSI